MKDTVKYRPLQKVPAEQWLHIPSDPMPEQVWKNDDFLVQVFAPEHGAVRISVNRTEQENGEWRDGITWEELQRIKREVGYGSFDAVEVYPAEHDVINVANMRHLWVLHERLRFAWRKKR